MEQKKKQKKERLPIPGALYPRPKLKTSVNVKKGFVRINKYFLYALTRFKLSGLQRAAFDVVLLQYWGSPDQKKDLDGYVTIPLSKFEEETGRDKGNLSRAINQIRAFNLIKTKKNLEIGRKHEKKFKIVKHYWEWLTDDPEFYYWCRDSKLWKEGDSMKRKYGSWENFREHRKKEREAQKQNSGKAHNLYGPTDSSLEGESDQKQSDEELLKELSDA